MTPVEDFMITWPKSPPSQFWLYLGASFPQVIISAFSGWITQLKTMTSFSVSFFCCLVNSAISELTLGFVFRGHSCGSQENLYGQFLQDKCPAQCPSMLKSCLFVYRFIPGCTQGLLLAVCTRFTSSKVQGTIGSVGIWTRIGLIQGQCLNSWILL